MVDWIDILEVIWKRKHGMIALFLVTVMVVSLYTFFIAPKIYFVKATLMPLKSEGGRFSGLETLALFAGIPGVQTGEDDINRFINILQSRTLTEQVIEDLNLIDALRKNAKDPPTKNEIVKLLLEHTVKVSNNGKGLVEITAELDASELAAQIVNHYVDCLDSFLKQNTLTLAKRKRVFVENQIEKIKEELASAEEKLRQFKEEHKVFAIDAQASQLTKIIGELRGLLMAKDVQLQVLEKFGAGAENEGLSQVRMEIEALKKQIQELEYGSALGGSSSESGVNLSINKLPKIEEELLRLMRDKTRLETLYILLVQEYERARLDEEREAISFIRLDKAIPPEKPVKPKKKFNIALAGIMGLFFGIGYAFLMESIENGLSERKRQKFANEHKSQSTNG